MVIIRSLNPLWRRDDFHARVAALTAVKNGDAVLDLGCGRGLTVPHLLAGVGASGKVVAADRSSRSLAVVGEHYSHPCSDGRLAG
jgi:ubiquinone/menaquinone biosynthesis C-methylase UbiE